MNGWRTVSVGDLAATDRYAVVGGPFGSALGRKDYIAQGVPVIRGAQLGGPGEFSYENLVFVSEKKADKHPGNVAHPSDIIVTQRGTVGQVGRVPEGQPYSRYLLSQSQMKLTVNASRADPRYVYYALLGPDAQQVFHGSTISAGVPHINLATFRELMIPLPPLRMQRIIAGILGSIDDLIENNRRQIELLEQIAQEIYREWFVRFRYPGHEDLALVDSPLGPIPVAWGIESLGSISALDRTSAQPVRSPDETFDHYSIPAFDAGVLPIAERGASIRSGKFILTSPAVLVSKLNPRIERTWLVDPNLGLRSVTSTEFLVLRPRSGHSLEFLYLLARSPAFQERLRELSGGTSTSHQRARPDDFLRIDVVVPPASLTDQLTDAVRPQLHMARTLRLKNRALSGLRDLLLPKLVTGQIDVSELDLDALLEKPA